MHFVNGYLTYFLLEGNFSPRQRASSWAAGICLALFSQCFMHAPSAFLSADSCALCCFFDFKASLSASTICSFSTTQNITRLPILSKASIWICKSRIILQWWGFSIGHGVLRPSPDHLYALRICATSSCEVVMRYMFWIESLPLKHSSSTRSRPCRAAVKSAVIEHWLRSECTTPPSLRRCTMC